MTIGEFLVLLVAVLVGQVVWYLKDFWNRVLVLSLLVLILSLAVAYKYLAGKYERNEL